LDEPLGRRLLAKHKDSISRLLATSVPAFSSTSGLPWKFKYLKTPRGWWKNPANQRQFIEWAVKEAFPESTDQQRFYDHCYHLTREILCKLGGMNCIKALSMQFVSPVLVSGRQLFGQYKQGSVCSILTSLYPHHKWEPFLFTQVHTHKLKFFFHKKKLALITLS